jgi:hypothetical protein
MWAKHATRAGIRNEHRILVGKFEGEREIIKDLSKILCEIMNRVQVAQKRFTILQSL